jgi:hypothetical protein
VDIDVSMGVQDLLLAYSKHLKAKAEAAALHRDQAAAHSAMSRCTLFAFYDNRNVVVVPFPAPQS